jgi:hypothetical protein
VRNVSGTHPNNGMHPTRDTQVVIKRNLLGGRVMPGVRTGWMRRADAREAQHVALSRSNKRLNRTRSKRACYHQSCGLAGYPQR